MYKQRQMNELSPEEIEQILWLAHQGDYYCNRTRLICNLFSISKEQLEELLIKYSHGKIFEQVEVDFS